MGDPISVRVAVELVRFPVVPAVARDSSGLACLLFHTHDDHLGGLRQMVLKGELVAEDGDLVFKVTEFVTPNGRAGTDQMPHAGGPCTCSTSTVLAGAWPGSP